MLAGSSKNLEEAFQRWLVSEDENDQSLNHKQFTEKLYYMILGWHIRGRLKGKLVDIDLELENTRLKDENMKLTLQNQEYRKDLIKAVGELKDKTELIEQYEKSHYGSKQ
jgi:hypothetical protein